MAAKSAAVNNALILANNVITLKAINEGELFDDAIRRPNCCNCYDGFFNSRSLSILLFNTKSYDKACKAI